MDQIQFKIVAEHFKDQSGKIQLSVECLINEKLVVNWEDLPVDILELKESAQKSGNYCIWTCTCDIPECGGVDSEGITITHLDNSVVWHNLDYPVEDANEYEFDKEQYVEAVGRAIRDFKKKYFELKNAGEAFEFCPDLRMKQILEDIIKA